MTIEIVVLLVVAAGFLGFCWGTIAGAVGVVAGALVSAWLDVR